MRHDDAVALIRARRAARPSRKRVPPALQPDGIRREYFAALKKITDRIGEILRSHVTPVLDRLKRNDALHLDAPPPPPPADGGIDPVTVVPDLNAAIANAAQQIAREFPQNRLEKLAAQVGQNTSDFQKKQWIHQVKSVVGVDPTQSEPWLHGAIKTFTRTNVGYIRKITEAATRDVHEHVVGAAMGGARHETLARTLQERLGVSESRAKLIARDQVGKFFGALAQARQKSAGVTRYIRRTAHDNRVREEHAALDGQSFSWDDPPSVGHPGEDINCRCSAEPDLEQLLQFEGGGDEAVALAGPPADFETILAPPADEPATPPAIEEPLLAAPAGDEYVPPERPDPNRRIVETPTAMMEPMHRRTVERIRALGATMTVEDYEHPEVQESIEDLALVPEHLMRELARRGYKFHVADRGVAAFPDGRHLKGVMSPQQVLWDHLPGAFNPASRAVMLGTGNPPGSGSLALHEVAHAIVQSRRLLPDALPILRRMLAEGRDIGLSKSYVNASREEVAGELLGEAIADTLDGVSPRDLAETYGDELTAFIQERVTRR